MFRRIWGILREKQALIMSLNRTITFVSAMQFYMKYVECHNLAKKVVCRLCIML